MQLYLEGKTTSFFVHLHSDYKQKKLTGLPIRFYFKNIKSYLKAFNPGK